LWLWGGQGGMPPSMAEVKGKRLGWRSRGEDYGGVDLLRRALAVLLVGCMCMKWKGKMTSFSR